MARPTYDIFLDDLVILSSDGTVTPIYVRKSGTTLTNQWNEGQSNLSAVEERGLIDNSFAAAQYNTTYYISDQIGSTRLSLAGGGWPVASSTFYPFGHEASSTDPDPYRFAQLERDSESSLDHATFREYSPTMGRWMRPDPYMGSYDFSDPQSFNRYSYVGNRPLSFIDPLGLSQTCYPISYWTSVDIGYGNENVENYGDTFCIYHDDLGNINAVGQSGGSGSPPTAAAAAAYTAPNNGQEPPPACQAKILNATNNQFGTNYTDANVTSTFNYSTGAGPGQGTLNLNIQGSTAGVSPGYYPVHWWTYVIGYGSTLHVVSGPGGNGGLDSQQTLPFGPNQGTFHIDSGYPHNPFGAIFHGILNMTKLGGYPKC